MKIKSHRELTTYQQAFAASMTIFRLSRSFPKAETYALTDQIRRSSRSVCANLAEAFRERKYPKVFVSKLIDCEAEAVNFLPNSEFRVPHSALRPTAIPAIPNETVRPECAEQ